VTASGTGVETAAQVYKDIGSALSNWDSTNLASMSKSSALLERSAQDLERFRDAVAAGIEPAVAVRRELLRIKSSIRVFLRVVDASSAFVAGISGITADRGIVYDSAGTARLVSSPEDVRREGPALCRTC
jgi:hypothetical protein